MDEFIQVRTLQLDNRLKQLLNYIRVKSKAKEDIIALALELKEALAIALHEIQTEIWENWTSENALLDGRLGLWVILII